MIVYSYVYLLTLPEGRLRGALFIDFFFPFEIISAGGEKSSVEKLLHDELLNVFPYIHVGLYSNKIAVCNSQKAVGVAGT